MPTTNSKKINKEIKREEYIHKKVENIASGMPFLLLDNPLNLTLPFEAYLC
jgi:hypothetical protein